MLSSTKKKRKQRLKVEIEIIDGIAHVIECPDDVYVKITHVTIIEAKT